MYRDSLTGTCIQTQSDDDDDDYDFFNIYLEQRSVDSLVPTVDDSNHSREIARDRLDISESISPGFSSHLLRGKLGELNRRRWLDVTSCLRDDPGQEDLV